MKALNCKEFAKEVMALANPSNKFEPQVYYNAHTDCVEFMAKNDDFYAERIDKLITVYYSRENNELIGSLIKGIGKLLNENPRLKILVQDGKVKLAYIFIAYLAMAKECGQKTKELVYQRLIEQAEDNKVEFPMCFA